MVAKQQIMGYPRLCNSTLLGITKESSSNGSEREHALMNIDCSHKISVNVNYTVFNLTPQVNWIFIGQVLNNANVSKVKEKAIFSKLVSE